MRRTDVLSYLAEAQDFVLVVRKDDRLVTISDNDERGMHELIMLAAEFLVDGSDEISEAFAERVGATVH